MQSISSVIASNIGAGDPDALAAAAAQPGKRAKAPSPPPPPPKPSQSELFDAETHWFHVFKAMIDSGELAKMEGSTVKVYLVIKAHTNFATGRAFPALETVAEKSGLSLMQVQRCIKQLEQHGYISKEKKGRCNVYTLREKIMIGDGTGRPTAVATWDYLPASVQQAVADLKNVLVSGDLAGAKIVHIERLQVNVTHLHDNAVNFNVQQFLADLDKLPPVYADKIRAAFTASQARKCE